MPHVNHITNHYIPLVTNLKNEIRSLGDVAIEREVRSLLADLQTELERLEHISKIYLASGV